MSYEWPEGSAPPLPLPKPRSLRVRIVNVWYRLGLWLALDAPFQWCNDLGLWLFFRKRR